MFVKKFWIWLYIIVLVADTIALAVPHSGWHFAFKILLMPLLMVWLIEQKKQAKEQNWRLILAGLVVAWAGDTLLLFSANNNLFFTLGLGCFLLTHIAYILYFFRYNKWSRKWLYQHPVLGFVVILYSVGLLGFLMPGLHHLMFPVAAYTLVICVMLLQALSAQPFMPQVCNRLFIPGAICFVLSDSMLAWDKFYLPFPYSASLIIAFYGVAQLLIVSGAVTNTDEILERSSTS